MKKIIINTSWDDGSVYDMKMIRLINKYSIPAIFYVPAVNRERAVVTPGQIKQIRQTAQLGSHTYGHVYLCSVDHETAVQEIHRGKEYLENILSEKVEHFCYPGGKLDRRLIEAAKKIVSSARTTRIFSTGKESEFNINTTLQVVYRRKINLYKEMLLNAPVGVLPALYKIVSTDYKLRDILLLFLNYAAAQTKGYFHIHLWGHSWEVQELGLWEELEELFIILQDFKEYFKNFPVQSTVTGIEME